MAGQATKNSVDDGEDVNRLHDLDYHYGPMSSDRQNGDIQQIQVSLSIL